VPYGFYKAWPTIAGRSAGVPFYEAILEWSAMPDKRRAQGPKPVLRTRPATMLTAIGLCVLIMVIQLVPQIRDIGAGRLPASATAAAR
jgi:hypothetical protein